MDWQRERDGLVVVVGLVVLVALAVGLGGSVGQFLSTALATFLGVLVALAVDRRAGGSPAGDEPAVGAEPAGGRTATAPATAASGPTDGVEPRATATATATESEAESQAGAGSTDATAPSDDAGEDDATGERSV
jgi:hypothetical protein